MKKILILLFMNFSCFPSEQQQLSLHEKTELFAKIKLLAPELQKHIDSYVTSFVVKQLPEPHSYEMYWRQLDQLPNEHPSHKQSLWQKIRRICPSCDQKKQQISYWHEFAASPAVDSRKNNFMFTADGIMNLGRYGYRGTGPQTQEMKRYHWVGPNKNGLILYGNQVMWQKKATICDHARHAWNDKMMPSARIDHERALHETKNEWIDLLNDKSSNSHIVVSSLGENNTIKPQSFYVDGYKLLVVDYDYGKPNPSKNHLCALSHDSLLFLSLDQENGHYNVYKKIALGDWLEGALPERFAYCKKLPHYKSLTVFSKSENNYSTILINSQTQEINKYPGIIGFCQRPNYLVKNNWSSDIYYCSTDSRPTSFFCIENLDQAMENHEKFVKARRQAMQKYIKNNPQFYLRVHQAGKELL
jgi:hypothetical protein